MRAAADAVLALWPGAHHDQPGLAAVLRANTTILTTHAAHAGDALWTPDGGHPCWGKQAAACSTATERLYNPAITHWETHRRHFTADPGAGAPGHPDRTGQPRRLLLAGGPDRGGDHHPGESGRRPGADPGAGAPGHPDRTGQPRRLLLAGGPDRGGDHHRGEGGRRLGAILGPEHPDTLGAQAGLAASYAQAGRTGEAITIEEKVAADLARIQGPEHPETLTAQSNLAVSYWQAGRTGEAISIEEKVAADRVRNPGAGAPGHPDRAGQPRRLLSAGGPDRGGDHHPGESGRRPGADPGAGAPGHPGSCRSAVGVEEPMILNVVGNGPFPTTSLTGRRRDLRHHRCR